MTEDSLLGLQLDEYRLEALLGRGGMARVYRGLDERLNRYVAIKVIDAPYRTDEEYVKRFTIEAQAIARLDHPHVVRLYRYGDVDGMLYMAMQFIEGADLGYLLESYRLDGERIAAEDALRLVKEICQALDYVHAHGIIHRDVKPSNIMLTQETGSAILTDFGLALRSEVGTRGEVFGSPHYIAPEQAVSSARAVPQSDLYALGVILYEMFTGILPFHAPEAMDIAVMHMSSPPPPPGELNPEINPEVEAVILKALEKKPEDRYQSGRALALALERALRKQPEQLQPTNRSIPERVTIGLANNPLPPLPPVPAAVTPAKPAAQPITAAGYTPEQKLSPVPSPNEGPARAAEPLPSPEQNRPAKLDTHVLPRVPDQVGNSAKPWLMIAGAALLSICLLACLSAGALALLWRASNQVAGIPQATSEATPGRLATVQEIDPPALEPTSPAVAEISFHLAFLRCEDEGCLVIANTGSQAFPMAELSMRSKDINMNGADWGVDILQPGQCTIVVKDEKWATRMPPGTDCSIVGPPLLREGKDRFWNNTFTVFYGVQKKAECEKKARSCDVLITP